MFILLSGHELSNSTTFGNIHARKPVSLVVYVIILFSDGPAIVKSDTQLHVFIIYLSRVLCLSVCVSQFVSERSAILLVLIIKLTKQTRWKVYRGRDERWRDRKGTDQRGRV